MLWEWRRIRTREEGNKNKSDYLFKKKKKDGERVVEMEGGGVVFLDSDSMVVRGSHSSPLSFCISFSLYLRFSHSYILQIWLWFIGYFIWFLGLNYDSWVSFPSLWIHGFGQLLYSLYWKKLSCLGILVINFSERERIVWSSQLDFYYSHRQSCIGYMGNQGCKKIFLGSLSPLSLK